MHSIINLGQRNNATNIQSCRKMHIRQPTTSTPNYFMQMFLRSNKNRSIVLFSKISLYIHTTLVKSKKQNKTKNNHTLKQKKMYKYDLVRAK
jgi:hypothetical protein